ncbi:MAG: CpaD family pilus assembly protein [Magnetospiraceae bacterium]
MTQRKKSPSLRMFAVAACCLGVVSLTGCEITTTPSPPDGFSVEENHPILVNHEPISIVVDLADERGELRADQGYRLQRFVNDYISRGTGNMIVEVSRRSGGASGKIVALLKRYGMRDNEIVVVGRRLRGAGKFAQLTFNGTKVYPPECPDWSKTIDQNYENTVHTNFGCANRRNIGLMVANPNDLVERRALDGPDATRAATIIRNYREGRVVAVTTEDVGGIVEQDVVSE